MSKNLIKYYWEQGSYSIKDMIDLVQSNIISKEDFFDITRMYFETMKKWLQRQEKKGYSF